MITRHDVLQVANDINFSLTEEQIKVVIASYPAEAELDPTGTWDLIIENIIYNLP